MCDEADAAILVLHTLQLVDQPLLSLRVKSGGWFVQQHDGWRVDDGPQDGQSPSHPGGKPRGEHLADRVESGVFQLLAHSLRGGVDSVHAGGEHQVLLRGQMRVEKRVVSRITQPAAQSHGRALLLIQPADVSRTRTQYGREASQQRRLAGAVGPGQGHDLTQLQREVHVPQDDATAESFPQAEYLDGRVVIRH